MRWVVHIGAPKTGSTSIQRFLFENRASLPAHGVSYPDVNLRGFGHHDLAFLLHGSYPDWATPQTRTLPDLCQDLRRSLESHRTETVVLSSEDFYLYPHPAALHRFLLAGGMEPGDAVAIVCYLRRQDEAHASWYNQTVKAQGNAASFEATVERDRELWNYASRLDPWVEEFGAGSIIIRDYSPFTMAPHDVRRDFLDLLGIPGDAFALPAGRANERINRDILDFQRLVNRLPLSPEAKRRYHKKLIDLTSATAGQDIFGDAPFLSGEQGRRLVEIYAEGNASVARRFLNQEQLFAPAPGPWTEDTPIHRGLTLAKIAYILRWMVFK